MLHISDRDFWTFLVAFCAVIAVITLAVAYGIEWAWPCVKAWLHTVTA